MRLRKITQLKYNYITFIIPFMMLFSCNITKHLKENEKMLVKNKVVIDIKNTKIKNLGFNEYDIEQIIRPKANRNYFKLWVYNLFEPQYVERKEKNKEKKCNKRKTKKIKKFSKKIKFYELEKQREDSERKIKTYTNKLENIQNKKEKAEKKDCKKQHWSKKMGKAPVFISANDIPANKRKIRVFLKNKGYYSPIVKINTTDKNKKLKIKYKVLPGQAYKIKSISYNVDDNNIKNEIIYNKDNSTLREGDRLDIKAIENERKRIADYLRDIGYYTFSKDYIFFSIDTIGKDKLAEIKINIPNMLNDEGKKIENKKHIINNIYIYPNFKSKEALTYKEEYFKNQDTIIFYSKKSKKYNIIYKEVPRINPKSIVRGLNIEPGDYFNLTKIKETYKNLASIQIIQTANIDFRIANNKNNVNDSIEFLDSEIILSQDMLQTYDLFAEVTHTAGNWGVAGNINYNHNNFLRNTEVFELKLNGELKRISINTDYELPESASFFNSKKFGTEMSIKFPRLALPHFIKKLFLKSNPNSILSGNYHITNRPDIKWSNAGGSWGYNFNSTSTIKHTFKLITADFLKVDYVYNDELLPESYEDRFIFGSSYKFTFNNQQTRKRKNYFFITAYVKAAGNSLRGIKNFYENNLNKSQNKIDDSYIIGGNAFAQFIKADIDIRYFRKLNRAKDNLVFRFYAGAALPYGNLNIIPFSEQYFSGGANGIRAWEERSLGPGSFNIEDIENIPYFNQRSDIKLETNFEYRMKLLWKLEGALFIDAGNIWAINNSDEREGAIFDINDFYKEIAIGSGFGLRIDFNFIIIRLDIGIKVKNPALTEANRWIPTSELFKFNNMKFNLGIGYPF